MWVVSDLIGQFLELAFQMVFAGVIGIRHGGSEENIDAVRRQASRWVTDRFSSQSRVTDRFSESADAHDQGPSQCTAFREVK